MPCIAFMVSIEPMHVDASHRLLRTSRGSKHCKNRVLEYVQKGYVTCWGAPRYGLKPP